jgi:hypothetical protein
MHPAIPIIVFGALIAAFGEDKPPPRPQERIVLLPDADGGAGAVTVITPGGETVLDQAYAAADVFAQGAVARVAESAASVQERFGAALEARPPAPPARRPRPARARRGSAPGAPCRRARRGRSPLPARRR